MSEAHVSAESSMAPPRERKQHGGRREGAGRKRSKQSLLDPSHAKRELLDARHPVHVILRACDDVETLRQRSMYEAIRDVLPRYLDGEHFRIVHISLQRKHIHLLVEATNKQALSRGMQSFTINAARAINRALDRSGKVFKYRYKAKQVRDRHYARNVIAYVLNNWRRHKEDERDLEERFAKLDRYSSAISFTGWCRRVEMPPDHRPLAVSRPRTGLLESGWQWHGHIDPFEVPGPLPQ